MVALGCKYLRICHLNNCATGVATQHNVLRAKYFIGSARDGHELLPLRGAECREIMASLGIRTIAELIGSTDHLETLPGDTSKQRKLDLSPLLANWALVSGAPQYCTDRATRPSTRDALDEQMVEDMRASVQAERGGRIRLLGQQFSSLHRRARLRRDRQALGQRRHGAVAADRHAQGFRRPELRRLERGRPAPASRRRGERLRRQGHGGRQDRPEAPRGGLVQSRARR